MEKNNAKDYPKFYYARHMKEGVAGYMSETILLTDDTIKKMLKSFDGKPVYIEHDERDEQERIDTLKETAVGYVTESFYNENDGWYWAKIMIIDDEAHEVINSKGWTVSNAYIPTQDRDGGTRHNVPYNREIVDGYFTHLALVPNPRYEDAKIFTPESYKKYQDEKRQQLNELKNSKTEETKGIMMNFFKFKKEQVSTVDADTFVEIKNSDGTVTNVKVHDMIQAVEEKQNACDDKEKANMDDKVELSNGETMTVSELVEKYQTLCNPEKENADDAEDDEKSNEDDKAEDEKANADSDDEDKAEEKQNHIKEMMNAHKGGFEGQAVPPFLKIDGLALGKAKY